MTPHTPAELLIRQRLRALVRALPGAEKGEVEPIHRARVATRRLREALPLALAHGRARKLERKVRRLTRALGPVRELDVALQTLDTLDTASVPAAALSRLRQVIRLERRRLHADMCREVTRVDLEKLRHRIGRLAARGRLTFRAAARDPRRLTRAQALAARRALRLRAAIDSAAGIYLPDRLHEVRIASKKLRYALEVTRDLSGSRAGAGLRLLKEVQDLLGRMHDLEVLIARVRAIQGSSQAPNLRLSADLDRLVRRLETECRQIHSHYTGLRSKLVAVCDQTIQASAGVRGSRPGARPAA
ncbi:MAG: hypothetical protein A3F70_03375 [Acidobacteria bacterium RIFCSPLOWO2_12_FULL_67_14]|nr:MAG: hypothetical protein A3H29_14265 [Acidobacteria bacterium RIFCSPLOWO2_02_FULL_67_21]OFW38825.1 MAG: hypothetical protein A3F70_03375 [Acidobacteria bacterium RIFCSPLOWO2_12_FULL_67_14]